MAYVDFFEGQARARRRTGLLVLFFSLAVVLILAAVILVVTLAFWTAAGGGGPPSRPPYLTWLGGQGELIAATAALTLLLIGAGTGVKILSMSGGGEAIAEGLGGVRVLPNTTDRDERRLLNVVEEVAIASGTPVPGVYLLPRERGINAFAAGLSHDRAVVAVTQGTMKLLSRDELQGVIAHEFSHILSGDMRINLRLIGVIHGIVILGLAGYFAMRAGFAVARGLGRGSGRGKGAGGVVAVVAGLITVGVAVMVIGYIGTFFARIIRAAVSRQRELLADSSAVQFTRNPPGLAGALKKIGGLGRRGSRIRHPRAEEASHMFFGQAFSSWFGSLFATHPELRFRIRRLDPSFTGRYPEVHWPERPPEERERFRPPTPAKIGAVALPVPVLDVIGRPDPLHLAYAAELTQGLADPLREAAREPWGARAVVYAMLLSADGVVRRSQLEWLAEHGDPGIHDETVRLSRETDRLERKCRIPLLDLAVAGLRGLSPAQYESFMANVDHLVAADRHVDVFEWLLAKVLRRNLEPTFVRRKPKVAQYYSLRPFAGSVGLLLSALARAGAREEEAVRLAFARGAQRLAGVAPALAPAGDCTLSALDRALEKLDEVSPKHKRQVLSAAAETIAADREVTAAEAELFRAIADSLGIPVPPVLPGQPLGAS